MLVTRVRVLAVVEGTGHQSMDRHTAVRGGVWTWSGPKQALEDQGWRCHRIWSADWFYRRQREGPETGRTGVSVGPEASAVAGI